MMLDRSYPSQLAARAKLWRLFTILSVMVFACASCSDTSQQTSSSGKGIVQRLHMTETTRLPLTDSAPPQLDATSTVPASLPQRTATIATPTPTPTPTAPTSYEAESSQNTLAGGAKVIDCKGGVCSGGERVGYIGLNAGTAGTLQFNNINKGSGGQYTLTVYYIIAGRDTLTMDISVNSGPEIALNVPNTANGDTIGTASITANLHAGNNTIEFSNSSSPAPDIDRIVV